MPIGCRVGCGVGGGVEGRDELCRDEHDKRGNTEAIVNKYIFTFLRKVLISLLVAKIILKIPESVHGYHVRIVQ